MKSILRVFTKRTSYTPEDNLVFIGPPPAQKLIPDHDEVHVSCVFTWDRQYADYLAFQWEGKTNKPVKLGGPAFGSTATDFEQGMYVKSGILFTTRGCNNTCPWCIVPKIEGRLKELPVTQGKIIQDNNFLQAGRAHKERTFAMLKTQHGICFKGGLQASLVDDHFVEAVRGLHISELWLACDTDEALPGFKRACGKLVRAGFTREHIKCYCLIGDDRDKNEARLREVYHAGAMPFAQLFRDFSDSKTEYSSEWNAFARQWQRPAAIKAHMSRNTDYHDLMAIPQQLRHQLTMEGWT